MLQEISFEKTRNKHISVNGLVLNLLHENTLFELIKKAKSVQFSACVHRRACNDKFIAGWSVTKALFIHSLPLM